MSIRAKNVILGVAHDMVKQVDNKMPLKEVVDNAIKRLDRLRTDKWTKVDWDDKKSFGGLENGRFQKDEAEDIEDEEQGVQPGQELDKLF
jgi:hypothetical protein